MDGPGIEFVETAAVAAEAHGAAPGDDAPAGDAPAGDAPPPRAGRPPVEWLAAVGGQIDHDSHGDLNLGVRGGAWTFLLRTDAPEITWAPSGERGRAWATLRGHAFAANMYISPWTDGAPDPGRALRASSVGAEAGWVGYGPGGLYAGGRAALDGVFFGAHTATTVPVPAPRAVATLDAIVGFWRPGFSAWSRAGVDFAPPGTGGEARRAPHLVGELHWTPDLRVGYWLLAPRAEGWAGVADAQDDLLYARVGGLNPWVVPLAGAAWAEWWAEDYAAVRVGPTIGRGGTGPGAVGARVSPFVDLATFGGAGHTGAAAGVGLGGRVWRGRAFVDVTGGYAPWIARRAGVSRASLWVALGWDWGTARGPADAEVPGPMGTY